MVFEFRIKVFAKPLAMEEAFKQFSNINKILPNIGSNNLKDLIKQIRACKTAQDERAVIQKEVSRATGDRKDGYFIDIS